MIHSRMLFAPLLFAVTLAIACDRDAPRTGGEASSPRTEPLPSADFRLAPERAGALRLGMPVDSVRAIYGPENVRKADLRLEGMPSPALEIRLPGGPPDVPSLTAELDPESRTVWRIRVHDPRFRDASGTGPGSSLGGLRAVYPALRIFHGEGNTVAVAPGSGLSFLLDPSDVPESFPRSGGPSVIPDNAEVIAVLVTG